MTAIVPIGPLPSHQSEPEVVLADAVTKIIGNAAQLARIKLKLTEQLDAMTRIAAGIEDKPCKNALIRHSDESKAELDRCFGALLRATQELPLMHNKLMSHLLR